jgi:hypothetical protein
MQITHIDDESMYAMKQKRREPLSLSDTFLIATGAVTFIVTFAISVYVWANPVL